MVCAEPAPCAAGEARVQHNGGSVAVHFTSPAATVSMSNPTNTTDYGWQSEALTDEAAYRFAVHVVTAAHPGGIETSNTDYVKAVPNSDVPDRPEITVTLV